MKSQELHGQNEQHPVEQENSSASKNSQPISALGQDSAYQPFEALGDNLYYQHLKITEPFNRLDQALNEYSKALELRPECPILLAKLSRVYLRQGNYKKAESKAILALEHQAKSSESIAIAGYTLGYIRYKENNFQASQQALEKSLYHGGWQSSRTLFCLFYTYWAIAKHSHNFLIKGWMGTLGSLCFALACLVSVLDPEPMQLLQLAGLVPHLIKAYCCENSHQRDKALQDYLALHQKYLGLAPLMNLIGSVYERNGQSEEALDWLQKAIHRDPLNEEGYFQMAA
ncbi:MAG: tetratricopeptide repeat protein, partial [Cyanobacteria bacterium]|nr:tetratricopeptide repeat protein [Cyanobacteriota bacterium]